MGLAVLPAPGQNQLATAGEGGETTARSTWSISSRGRAGGHVLPHLANQLIEGGNARGTR